MHNQVEISSSNGINNLQILRYCKLEIGSIISQKLIYIIISSQAFLVLYIIRMVFFIKLVNVKVTKWLPMCTEIYRLVQRAPKQLPRSLQRFQKESINSKPKIQVRQTNFTQRFGDFSRDSSVVKFSCQFPSKSS